ncbi:MAG: hypothetical protein JWM80_3348 [Cyanobacteria bacterium RYN_339]|nr:hypothetical protein [Cyanobacteria bacterium RYN_339]
MSNRDQFERRTSTSGFAQQGATRPLAYADPGKLYADLAATIERAGTVIRQVEPTMEWLHQCCIRAKLPLSGVPDLLPSHPVTPQGEELITYCFTAFRANPMLSQTVQIAVFRFYDARKALREGQVAADTMTAQPPHVEQLRLKTYFLVNYHAEFRADAMLSRAFPSPRTAQPAVPLTNVQRLKQKLVREGSFNKAEIMLDELKGPLASIRQVLETVEKPSGMGFRELMMPEMRRIRIMVIGLKTDEEALSLLRDAVRQYDALKAGLAIARKSGDPAQLADLAFPLAGLAPACLKHPLLATLFNV